MLLMTLVNDVESCFNAALLATGGERSSHKVQVLAERTSVTIPSANISWASFLFYTMRRCSGATHKLYKIFASMEQCFFNWLKKIIPVPMVDFMKSSEFLGVFGFIYDLLWG